MTPLVERSFKFCDMSHIRFGVGAISSPEPVLAAFTSLENCAVVGRLIMFLVLLGVLSLVRGLLMMLS